MKKWIPFICCLFAVGAAAQDSTGLDRLMEMETQKNASVAPPPIPPIFRATRVCNGHSVETLPAKILDIKIQHRFGYLSGGFKTFFGLDDANIRIGADYGITSKLMLGFGRASYDKQWDCYAKYKILTQGAGPQNTPVSLAIMGSAMIQSLSTPAGQAKKTRFQDRGYYAGQLLVARRFGKWLSLQVMPTIVHYNLVPLATDPNDILSVGSAASVRLSQHTSLVLEYYYNLPGHKFENTKNALSVGLDIETGGHVFQLLLTNGHGISERHFIAGTTGDFFDGDIQLGFNVSRVFQTGRGKKKQRQ